MLSDFKWISFNIEVFLCIENKCVRLRLCVGGLVCIFVKVLDYPLLKEICVNNIPIEATFVQIESYLEQSKLEVAYRYKVLHLTVYHILNLFLLFPRIHGHISLFTT